MANSKISELSELTTVANDDVLAIVDDSTSTTKKISFANLSAGISVGNATQLQFTALNSTGSTLTKGSAVYVSGHTSETQVADADNTSAASMPAFGIVSDDILNGATGTIVIGGEVSGINTSCIQCWRRALRRHGGSPDSDQAHGHGTHSENSQGHQGRRFG